MRGEWQVGNWSACDNACGLGYQTRELFCSNASDEIDPAYCDAASAPDEVQECESYDGCPDLARNEQVHSESVIVVSR